MGAETELLEWIRLKRAELFYGHAEGRQYTLEKKKRENNIKDLEQHEAYMVEQGFKIDGYKLVLPNGENYEL